MKYLGNGRWAEYMPSTENYRSNYDAIDWSNGGERAPEADAAPCEQCGGSGVIDVTCYSSAKVPEYVDCSCRDNSDG